MKENIKANTWLPIFPGFYETIFDEDFESELDYVKDTSLGIDPDAHKGIFKIKK